MLREFLLHMLALVVAVAGVTIVAFFGGVAAGRLLERGRRDRER